MRTGVDKVGGNNDGRTGGGTPAGTAIAEDTTTPPLPAPTPTLPLSWVGISATADAAAAAAAPAAVGAFFSPSAPLLGLVAGRSAPPDAWATGGGGGDRDGGES